MKILVSIKRVMDPYLKVRVKRDFSGIETEHAKMVMNPFDEIALEEALRLREKGLASEIILVSIGNNAVQETLRAGLALGADRAIHVFTESILPSLSIAKLLKVVVEQENPGLCLLGKQSIDGDNNQTGQMLASLLNWPQATFASLININAQEVEVTREVDDGLETLLLQLPAIITTDLRLNEPRYATLSNIMKARQKPLTIIKLES